jgi:amino acid transporter
MDDNKDAGEDKETKSTPEKPKLSLMSGIALLIGSIIGSGIFISPRGVLLGTGKFPSMFSLISNIKMYSYCSAA